MDDECDSLLICLCTSEPQMSAPQASFKFGCHASNVESNPNAQCLSPRLASCASVDNPRRTKGEGPVKRTWM